MHKVSQYSRFLMLTICAAAILSLATPATAQRKALPTAVAAPAQAQALNPLPEAQTMRLAISLPLRNQQQLTELLQQLYNPASPNYHHFLTVAEFTAQFGPTQADYAKVIAFAQAHGLSVTHTFANRLVVSASGSPAAVGEAFHVNIHEYQHPTEARHYYAPDVEPTVDADLPILTVDGLSNYELPHSMLKRAAAGSVHADTTGSASDGEFYGSDMRAAYVGDSKLDGTGQTVGMIELGPYNLRDVQNYFKYVGQPLKVPIYNVLMDVDGICSGIPATGGCDDGEEVIDIEQAISMAPNLAGLIVYESYGDNSSAINVFAQAASDNIVKSMSLSFGWGGTPDTNAASEQAFQEFAAQGQNIFIASGDGGSFPGTGGYPGNSTYVTDSGGTDLVTASPGGAWQSESGWGGSGGGWNTGVAIPTYQVPAINAQNQGSKSYRNVPDVAMEANTDNIICGNGVCGGGIGGTSLAAPRWAGFLALANQQANGTPVGFLNPTIYALGQTANYPTDFHDITTGDNFNSDNPDLFSATTGYDLVTGFGSPNGQAWFDAIAPANTTSPNFTVTASEPMLRLIPGACGKVTITVAPTNGFKGVVNLTATAPGAPDGVKVTLSNSTITASGTATLDVTTTDATPGGNFLVAITGVSGSISKIANVELQLPFFSLDVSPTTSYVDQSGTTKGTVTVTPQNGFSGEVTLSASSLPEGVKADFNPRRTRGGVSTFTIIAESMVPTGLDKPLAISATNSKYQTFDSSLDMTVSAAIGAKGMGIPVDLSKAYNLNAIYADGKKFTTKGLDGDGWALSANILSASRVLSGVLFKFGATAALDAVYGTGQTIALPTGKFTTLQLLATGINGDQAAQPFVVTYTDGSTVTLKQSFSDWYSPANNVNEEEAVAMPYRIGANGSKDNRQFNLYGYTFVLNSGKTVKSLTLPTNRDVVILAATLNNEWVGSRVDLSSSYNAAGIYTDGTTFNCDTGGLDAGGTAYSADLLGDQTGASSMVVNGLVFDLPASNFNNVVYGTGKTVPLTKGKFKKLYLLGTGVQGPQTAQKVIVTYTDGTTSQFTQSFSDWSSLGGYSRESEALAMAYRDICDGTTQTMNFNLYEYTFPLNSDKTVQSLTLPNNRDVVAVSATLK